MTVAEGMRRLSLSDGGSTSRRKSPLILTMLASAAVVGVGLVAIPVVRATLVALALAAVAWILFLPPRWFADLDRATRRVIVAFLVIRLAMPVVSESVGAAAGFFFTGGSDAFSYHEFGGKVATDLLQTGEASSQRGPVPGSAAIDLAVGYLYTVGAPVRIVTYYLWNLFAVIGMLLFWWSTHHLTGNRRPLYAALVLLTPTLLFWNAGLSKEAPMALATGCIVAGVHLLSEASRTARGLAYMGIGVAVASFVRPHIALLMVGSAVLGVGISRAHHGSTAKARRVVPLIFSAALLLILLPATRALIDSSGEASSFVDAAYERAEDTAAVGGRSSFETSPTRSVADMPEAVVTVLFRPFPWEVRTVPQLLASAEAALIGGMLAVALWRVIRRRARFERSPLVLMSVAFTLLFSAAFASLGNFGLLVRERSQVLAFVILLLFSVRDAGLDPLGRGSVPLLTSRPENASDHQRTAARP